MSNANLRCIMKGIYLKIIVYFFCFGFHDEYPVNWFSQIFPVNLDTIIKFIVSKMSGFLSVIELMAGVGFASQLITTEVFQAKLNKQIKQHQKQFDLMTKLNDFVNELTGSDNLYQQIQTTSIMSINNWQSIQENMKINKILADKIQENFQNIRSLKQQFTWKHGIEIGFQAVFSLYMMSSFFVGKEPGMAKLKGNMKDLKNSMKKIMQRNAQKVYNEKERSMDTLDNDQLKTRVSQDAIVQIEPTKMQKAGNYISGAMRIVALAAMVYGIYTQAIAIQKLVKHLDETKKYFQKDGQFEKAQASLIDLMRNVAGDTLNLLVASRAMCSQVRSILTLNAMIVPAQRQYFIKEAEKFSDKNLGFSDDVLKNSYDLLNQVKDITYKGGQKQEFISSFTTIVNAFQAYMTSHNPRPLLNNITKFIVNETGLLGQSMKIINNHEQFFNQFKFNVADQMADRNKTIQQIQNDPKVENKADAYRETDRIYYNTIFDYYKEIYVILHPQANHVPPKHDSQLQYKDKEIIVEYIALYTQKFYSHDQTGQSILGINIQEMKSPSTVEQDLNVILSSQNMMTIPNMTSSTDQDAIRKPFRDYLRQNKPAYFDQKKYSLIEQYRYMRIQVKPAYHQVDGKKYDQMVHYYALYYLLNDKTSEKNSYFGVEKDLLESELAIKQFNM